jgi:hypothetical protein
MACVTPRNTCESGGVVGDSCIGNLECSDGTYCDGEQWARWRQPGDTCHDVF